MKIYRTGIIPESSKIEIFKLAVGLLPTRDIDPNLLEIYSGLLEIYCEVNKNFDKEDRRKNLIFDMPLEHSK